MNITSLLAIAAMGGVQGSGTLEEHLEAALGAVGLGTKTARFDENLLGLFRTGEFTTPFYDACSENPWRIPFFADSIRRDLAAAVGKPNDALNIGARLVGFGTRRTLIGNPISTAEERSKKPDALKSVLDEMAARKLMIGRIPSTTGVPEQVQSAAVLILAVLPDVLDYRKTALRDLGNLDPVYAMLAKPGGADTQGSSFDALLRIYRKVGLSYLGAGGHDLMLAAQNAAARLAGVQQGTAYNFEIETVWGWIRLTGGTATIHSSRPTLLIIDTGGNDIYLGSPSTSSSSNWASIVIDTDGEDKYLSDPALAATASDQFSPRFAKSLRPGPGGALLGYTVLVDLNGADLYRSHVPGIGSGRIGVASVLDMAGNDTYDGYQDSQGFGLLGAGILEDVAGDDHYRGFNQVQGLGQTRGFGYLVDRAGKDEYMANDSVIDFPSPQSAQHNVSMSQGAGNGRRGDYLDGHSLAGGVGILFDQNGVDHYVCGVFGQGVGYWEGVGMLWDTGDGGDVYEGQWYSQGASAHFAIGYLEDEGGNDGYTAPMNMAQGAGHDFSFGALIDRAGDDRYKAPNLSLGAGNANGIGLLVDFLGNDIYESSGITLGKAAEAAKGSLRARALCLGVFIDLAGDDVYPKSLSWAANAARVPNITEKGPTPPESQAGVFWDR